MTPSRWMTRKELTAELRVSVDTVRTLETQGKLPKPVYLTPRLPRYDRQAVEAALGVVQTDADARYADEVMERIARAARRPKGGKRARRQEP
ncbi:helix-turn-helix transcriptional regulator [Azospirillum argentinense]